MPFTAERSFTIDVKTISGFTNQYDGGVCAVLNAAFNQEKENILSGSQICSGDNSFGHGE